MKEKLIILGTGFAGMQLLRKIDTARYEVTIVSPRNYFLFTPLLTSTTVGTLEFRSIIEPIRATRKGCTYVQSSCTGIDLEQQHISCSSQEGGNTFTLPFDRLVIAVGGANATFNIPGVESHALFLKDLADARAIRQRVIECLEHASMPHLSEAERARLLHFVVVGGGPTGVEFAAELHDFLKQDLKKWFPTIAESVQLTLIDAGERLLSTFAQVLSSYTMRNFKKRNINVRQTTWVTQVEKNHILLGDGSKLAYGLLVWSGGIAPTPLAASLPFSKDSAGRIHVNHQLQVIDHPQVYALGDCAAPIDQQWAQTAQVAQQQGAYLARALNRIARGKKCKPFRYRHMGMLAYVGGNRALLDLPGLKGRGFTAWILWRSIYLTKLVSFKNKVLVLFDWGKTRCFGRDISKF